jgi:putative molybdopterin biosynthesis protein
MLLDAQLRRLAVNSAEVKGYRQEEQTHMAVANRVVQGQADVGLGAQSAASVAGLDFIPLVKERYDLVMLKATLDKKPLSVLPDILRSDNFLSMLRSIPGYDISATGQMVIVSPGK